MAQPMRECPVCEAIVLLDQDRCSICDHDLSAPAPDATPAATPEPVSSPDDLPQAAAANVDGTEVAPDEPNRIREGSIIVGLVFFVAAAVLIGWFVQQEDPIDDTTSGDGVAADGGDEVELARAVCVGTGQPLPGAPAYSPTPGVHPAALLLGDLSENDVATSTSLFPAEWIVDLSQRPLDASQLLLCVSRTPTDVVDSNCPAGDETDGLVRLEASYRIRVFETATATQLADEPVASAPFGPCPDAAATDPGNVYPDPSPEDLVRVVVPLVFIGE